MSNIYILYLYCIYHILYLIYIPIYILCNVYIIYYIYYLYYINYIYYILEESCRYPSTEVSRDCKESNRAVQGRLQKRIASILVNSLVTISAQKFAREFCDESSSRNSVRIGKMCPKSPTSPPRAPKIGSWELDFEGCKSTRKRPTWTKCRPRAANLGPRTANFDPRAAEIRAKATNFGPRAPK